MGPEMRLVRAPAPSAALSTYSMALSVEELARNVPPTARIYGELKNHSRSNQAWQRSYTESSTGDQCAGFAARAPKGGFANQTRGINNRNKSPSALNTSLTASVDAWLEITKFTYSEAPGPVIP